MRPIETSRTKLLPLGSDAEERRRFMVIDRPVPGNLRFGLTLEILDTLAEETALAYVRRFEPEARVVTAAIDSIRVRYPADVTRDLRFLARINYVGRTSLEVGIRVEQPGDPPLHIASCYFTMVARVPFGGLPPAFPPLCVDAAPRARRRRSTQSGGKAGGSPPKGTRAPRAARPRRVRDVCASSRRARSGRTESASGARS